MPMITVMARYLMGAREIEERLGVSRQRVQQLTARADWPAFYDELAMGKVWRKQDIEAWILIYRPDLAPALPASDASEDAPSGSVDDSDETA